MKFLLCCGAEKAGTTWLHQYFSLHPEYLDLGKELNLVQRDDLVPDLENHVKYRKDIYSFFEDVARCEKVTGDFTHYEGSTENIFRLYQQGLERQGIEIVPVYIMRDPVQRAWSSWKMIDGGYSYTMPRSAKWLIKNYLSCKYKETVQALDNVFEDPLYFFYEEFFTQENIDKITDRLEIQKKKIDPTIVNPTHDKLVLTNDFIREFCLTDKNIEAVRFIKERFERVPWKIEDYQKS